MSLMNELKNEISKLARREIKKEMEPVKRVNAAQRKYIADLRKEIGDLQKEVNRLKRELGKTEPAVMEKPAQRSWITGKGVVSLRNKLGLTQAELADLAGVSTQSVVKWEKTDGKIPFRQEKTAARVQDIRGMTKKQAQEELAQEELA